MLFSLKSFTLPFQTSKDKVWRHWSGLFKLQKTRCGGTGVDCQCLSSSHGRGCRHLWSRRLSPQLYSVTFQQLLSLWLNKSKMFFFFWSNHVKKNGPKKAFTRVWALISSFYWRKMLPLMSGCDLRKITNMKT